MTSATPKEDKIGGRLALVGAGALGLYYGGRLALAGEDVFFLLRSDYEEVKTKGITIDSIHGDAALPAAQVKAFRQPQEIGPVDWVIIGLKTTANAHYTELVSPLMGPGTRILTLQNGLGNCEELARLFGPEKICGGLCFVCLNRTAPGRTSHTGGGKITIGEWKPEPGIPLAQRWATGFRRAGVPAEAVEDLPAAQWRKLVWNIPFNGMAIAEGGLTTDLLLDNPHTAAELRALMEEVVEAARHQGHELESGIVDTQITRTRPMGDYKPSSMIDFLAGKPVEYEAIWGEPLRRAQASGLEMPHLTRLAARIRERLRLPDRRHGQ